MRAFTKAAVLLLVQSVAAESIQAPVRRVSATETIPTAYITLNVPVQGAETQVVPFRLDLVEAGEPCSPAQVSINGHRLAQNGDGFGQGDLALDDGLTITSNWTFACQSLKQALTIHVQSINGRPAAGPASLTANFYQTTPVQITSVEDVASVRYLHLHTTVTQSLADSGEEHTGLAESDNFQQHPVSVINGDSVQYELSRLKELRSQARELATLIRNQEAAVIDRLDRQMQDKLAREPTPTPLADCRDVRCAFKALAYRFRHSHEEVCESASGWRAVFGCAPREQQWDDEDGGLEYTDDMAWLDNEESVWEDDDGFYATYEEDMLAARYESTRSRMLLLVAETAVIFGTLVFLVTSLLRRLTTGRRLRFRRRAHSELPLYQDARYFDEPKTLLSFGFVCHDVEAARPRRTAYPVDEKAILRAADDNEARRTTTVAEEIAELRAAASVVSDLVAVDEAERRTSVDYDDEAPPAYERGEEREHSL
ncbi:hypothetical protein CCM_03009 [Cordyceps militaris CM01]|uniref:Uncharacterized protein n=1 Tax=Cordyceps militaris (strain CM01) TaxID=983644 RepID=G3J899_CORMM|nr:uncharacterized protein CCM_03009 [Cordyceps militaris CM01]EGX94738.1 hypothetical protein CCM_03009 [Cordyceps militaris CM01]